MSDDNGSQPFYGVTVTKYILGDAYCFRGRDDEDLEKLSEGLAARGDNISKGLSAFAQAVVANMIVTSDKERGAAKSTPSSNRRPDSGPPGESTSDTPRCQHGDYKDLSGRGYKKRWYCAAPKGDKQCPALD